MLGYKKGENDLPEIIPEEAEIVKEIFRSYLDGMSLKQIADSLNSRGVKTKHKQTTWQSEIVKSVLVNEKYTGDALLQKTYITDCITKKSRKNNGELPMYLVKNHHELDTCRNPNPKVRISTGVFVIIPFPMRFYGCSI